MYSVTKEMRFEAAHCLTKHDGQCSNPHGHSWLVRVTVEGERLCRGGPKEGMLIDYGELGALMREVVEPLDHTNLNEELNFYPTSEMLAKYIFEWLQDALTTNQYQGCWLREVEVQETEGNRCSYTSGRRP
ncbi:MAG: 6-carboxytetrahydropterin synthase QueD [bacterium]|nr:6-carboxytetrahydropterin synthase QueD [bacterium]